MLVRTFYAIYVVLCVAITAGSAAYGIAFAGNLSGIVPKTIDTGEAGSLATSVLIDLGLLAIFALQHSVMARPGFKRWWTRLVPQPLERSTYLLLTGLALFCLYWQWHPIPILIWSLENPFVRMLLRAISWAGLAIVVWAQASLHPVHFFGIEQVRLYLRNMAYTPPEFTVPGPYRYVRHPVMIGLLLALWAAPAATAGYVLFAAVLTAYISVRTSMGRIGFDPIAPGRLSIVQSTCS